MKVLHIVSGNLEEGAARGALNLHLALMQNGIKSALLIDGIIGDKHLDFQKNQSRPRYIRAQLTRRINHLPTLFYRARQKQKFTNVIVGKKLSKDRRIGKYDVLHFHWVDSAAFDFKDLEEISQPIVWTLRDMWPFTGGCHYTYQCKGYLDNCGSCPQLSSNKALDLSLSNIKTKILVKKSIKYVAVSNWLKQRALESSVMKLQNIDVIYNGVDTEVFYPEEEKSIRERFQIQENKLIVLVGAIDLIDKYKGLEILIKALSMIEMDFVVLSFGKTPIESKLGGHIKVYDLGYLRDPHDLAKVYNTADLFVSASISEAFGKTVAESLACGTPVVCFSDTGSAEIVIDGKTGAIARNGDVKNLAECIASQLKSGKIQEKSQDCRSSILQKFDSADVANKYLEIYRDLTSQG